MTGSHAEQGGDELEQRAIELLKQNRDGMLQTDLWKSLNITSREGSRLVLRLMRRGLVKREEVTVGNRKTYKVYLVETAGAQLRILVDVSSIIDIPCTKCLYLNDCGHGGFYDPSNCALLEAWLRREAAKYKARTAVQQRAA